MGLNFTKGIIEKAEMKLSGDSPWKRIALLFKVFRILIFMMKVEMKLQSVPFQYLNFWERCVVCFLGDG